MSNLTVTEQQALAAIDLEGLLATLDALVAVPSLSGSADEVQVQHRVAKVMRQLGIDVETWALDFEQLKQHRSYSAEIDRSDGLGVIGSYGNGDGPTLILNGHTDVVPAGELDRWHYPPFRATLDEGNVYGRGALDMKGGLCCALFALKAIIDSDIQLKGKVVIEPVSGEEDGGVGTLATVVKGISADAAIIMEPTELMIAPAQAGAYNFRVTIPGAAAHGAMRHEGVDPLEKFLLVYQVVLNLEKQRNAGEQHPLFATYDYPYPICCGTIQGGVWASTVAETLSFEGRYGVKIGEVEFEAKQMLEQVIADVCEQDSWLRENPATVEWWGAQFDPCVISAEHPIATTTVLAHQQITKTAPIVQGMTYGADMRLLVNDGGIPTIMYGPGDVRLAHRPDEYVPLADLKTCTKTLILTILRFCGCDAKF